MNRIEQMSQTAGLKLMTHVVGGYPSFEANREVMLAMAAAGASCIEIQIPFSDPMADGPTIMAANQKALDNGVTVEQCFQFVQSIRPELKLPLLLMTYTNIPFRMGFKKFVQRASQIGIDGLIVPDLPLEEQSELRNACEAAKIAFIQVVAPDVHPDRLKRVVAPATGFIYTTLKVGITGTMKAIGQAGVDYVSTIKKLSPLPVFAGFGISSKVHVDQLRGVADGAVIGSHLLHLYDQSGVKSVEAFISSLGIS